MLIGLLMLSTVHAAPWPVRITAPAPQVTGPVVVYRVAPNEPLTRVYDLQDALGLTGLPEWVHFLGGGVRAQDGDRFAWSWEAGGLAFHDVPRLSSELPIQPMPEDEMWEQGAVILQELGADTFPYYEIMPSRTGHSVSEAAGGRRWITDVSTIWAVSIEGLAVFGPGGEVELTWDGDELIGLMDPRRIIEPDEFVQPDSWRVALHRWSLRADREHHWNLYAVDVPVVRSVEIRSVELGYLAPPLGSDCPLIEPVYQIEGIISGADEDGVPRTAELLWWEPVSAERSLPSLQISPMKP